MAINGNICTELGDVLLFETIAPLVGIVSLTSYSNIIIGETPTNYFTKEFKYSRDGLNYSDWQILNDANLQLISLIPTDTFFINYKYTKSGTNNFNPLTFISITIDGVFTFGSCGITFENSIFSEFINCPDQEVLTWCINVTEKAYKPGIIPNYIERRLNQDTEEDRDYIDFWRTVACFSALLVVYARRILERFSQYFRLINIYLQQRGMFSQTDVQNSLFLKQQYLSEIRQRGTLQIIKENSLNQLISTAITDTKSSGKEIDGELLRLIGYNNYDDFNLNRVRNKDLGWNLGNSSPMYRGLCNHKGLEKAYENNDNNEILNLSQYPLLNSNKISLINDGGISVMKIENTILSDESGIDGGIYNIQNLIKINPLFSYQVSFWIKIPNIHNLSYTLNDLPLIKFGVRGYNVNNIWVPYFNNLSSINPNTCLFFQNHTLNQTDKWYHVTGIIYNMDLNHNSYFKSNWDKKLNIGFGQNLKFPLNVRKIVPIITSITQNINFPCIYVKGLSIKLLNTEFSTGFLNNKDWIEMFFENNQSKYSMGELQDIITRYFLSYNNKLKLIYSESIDSSSSTSSSTSSSISSSNSSSNLIIII